MMVMMMMMCRSFSSHANVFESPTKTTSDPSSASLLIKSSSRNRDMCYIAGLLYWMCNDVNTASKHSRGLINSTKLNDQQRKRLWNCSEESHQPVVNVRVLTIWRNLSTPWRGRRFLYVSTLLHMEWCDHLWLHKNLFLFIWRAPETPCGSYMYSHPGASYVIRIFPSSCWRVYKYHDGKPSVVIWQDFITFPLSLYQGFNIFL